MPLFHLGGTSQIGADRMRCKGLRTRSLNDPHQGSLPTVLLHLDQVQTVTSGTIRPRIRLLLNGPCLRWEGCFAAVGSCR